MPTSTPGRPAVCGERGYLLSDLIPAVLTHNVAGAAEPGDVEQDLRCTLEAHTTGDHHSLVMELPGPDTGAVWTRWTRGHYPTTVTALLDCPSTDPDTAEPCCEFAGHPGAHSYEHRK
ncbi:hypothetical protein [Streptomyces sp.]|uniref:hypothetical protein n=1 Tax=Streptomyces sp. TaxID=1931 RepID=UPI002F425321